MRKIEELMISAIKNRKYFSLSNTQVHVYEAKGYILVYLHYHVIAQIDFIKNTVRLNNCGYYISTTKSRLNAILTALDIEEWVVQKDGNWYFKTREVIDGRYIYEYRRFSNNCYLEYK